MKPKDLHLIVNPVSGRGKGRQILERVKPMFQQAGVELRAYETQDASHGHKLVRELELGTGSAVGGLGGDGTMHQVVNGLLTRSDGKKPPIANIPCGTGNDLALNLGITDPEDAAHKICAGNTSPVDIGLVETTQGEKRYMAVCLIWGYVYDLTLCAERNRWTGLCRYTVAALHELLRHEPREGKLILDGRIIDGKINLFMVFNTTHSGRQVSTIPHAKLDDGLFDVLMLRHGGKLALLKTLAKLQVGKVKQLENIDFYAFQKMELIPAHERDCGVNVDGEWSSRAPVKLTNLRKEVEFYC